MLEIWSPLIPGSLLKFDRKLGVRLGIELEYVLPFNKDKWSLFLEPGFQYYRADAQSETRVGSVSYTSLEVAWGARHYFYLNKKNRVYLSGNYIVDLPFNSKIEFVQSGDLDFDRSNPNLSLSVGYGLATKYGVEFRYGLSRNVFANYLGRKASYDVITLTFSYRVY